MEYLETRRRGAGVRGRAGVRLALSLPRVLHVPERGGRALRCDPSRRPARLRQLLPARGVLFVPAGHGAEAPGRAARTQTVNRRDDRDARRARVLAAAELDPELGDGVLHHDRHHDDGRARRVARLQPVLLVFGLPDGKDLQDDPSGPERHPRGRLVREVRPLRESVPVRVLPAREGAGWSVPRPRLHALPPLCGTLPETGAFRGGRETRGRGEDLNGAGGFLAEICGFGVETWDILRSYCERDYSMQCITIKPNQLERNES